MHATAAHADWPSVCGGGGAGGGGVFGGRGYVDCHLAPDGSRDHCVAVHVLGIAGGLALAPTASADAGSYLQDLRNYGLNVSDEAGAVADGQMVCQMWGDGRHGALLPDIVNALQNKNPGLARHDADLAVRAALQNLCPGGL
jgi:hypothetical protein